MANSAYSVGFYFELSFSGEEAAFQEVSGIGKELGIEEIICGGENQFKYRLPTVATSQNLVLKRALMQPGSKLANWCASSIDGGLIKPIQTHDISVKLLVPILDGSDKTGIKNKVSMMWTFYKAYPVKYAISEFKSQESGLVVESVELAYTYFKISSNLSPDGLFA